MTEKRKYRRFKSKLLIATVYRNEMKRMVVEDSIISEDISVAGMRIVFPRRLPKGRILDLKVFFFSDPIHLPARGRVVWSSEKQGLKLALTDNKGKADNELFWVGIEFIDIDSFTRERILRWIEKEFHVKEV